MKILVPLPDNDFDPTESSVPWRALKDAGHDVVFATERGARPACDPLLLTGVVFGQLGAIPDNVALYRTLEVDAAFQKPVTYDAIVPGDYHALLIPGGHAKGMKQMLDSAALAAKIKHFVDDKKPVAAICHGVLALVRSGAVSGRTMTALPKWMERAAYFATAWKLGDYYRTYPEYVEDEVRRLIGAGGSFVRGPLSLRYADHHVVEDKELITARWPGDAKAFGEKLVARLAGSAG